jgi:soluble lytic murein transglycosylase-like protein
VALLESSGDPNAVGKQGEKGLMQLMPATARALGVDPANREESIRGAAKFLRHLMVKYRGNIASVLAAYNEGEPAFDRHRRRGEPLPETTRHYVERGLALLRGAGRAA